MKKILEDLRKQGAAYLKRSNKIPMAVLGYLTPKEKRAEFCPLVTLKCTLHPRRQPVLILQRPAPRAR